MRKKAEVVDKKEYFECRCHSPEHTLSFVLDDDKTFPALYGYVFLNEEPWYRRVLSAIKYAFGYKCKYGHFDEFILNPDDCDRLMIMLKQFKSLSKKKV
jgi:hypothetical protein